MATDRRDQISDDYIPAGFKNAVSEEAMGELIGAQNEAFAPLGFQASMQGGGMMPGKMVICSGCGDLVDGRVLDVMNASWHTKCFKCSQCDMPINLREDKGFMVKKGSSWCYKCDKYDREFNDGDAGKEMQMEGGAGRGGGGAGHDDFGARSQQAAYGAGPGVQKAAARGTNRAQEEQEAQGARDKLEEGKENCASCQQVIVGQGYGVKNLGWYHPECFMCSHCGELIEDGKFRSAEGSVFHPECAPHTGPLCTWCGEPLIGKYKVMDDKKYHSECLFCYQCHGTLERGYILKGGDPYCGDCGTGDPVPNYDSSHVSKHVSALRFDQANQEAYYEAPEPEPHYTPEPEQEPAPQAEVASTPKFCPQCGQTVTPGTKFCGECGCRF